jgi:hypothetical protein
VLDLNSRLGPFQEESLKPFVLEAPYHSDECNPSRYGLQARFGWQHNVVRERPSVCEVLVRLKAGHTQRAC